MKLKVSPDFLLSLLFIFFMNSPADTLLFFTAAFFHEAGHLSLLKRCKVKKTELVLGLAGAEIIADTSRLSYKEEMAVSLAGVLFNSFLCLLCLLALRFVSSERIIFFFFANLFYALVNLFPIRGLDGGRALECALLSCLDLWLAERVFCVVSLIFTVVLAALSLWALFFMGTNVTLVILASSLVFQCIFSKPCCRSAS